MWNSLPLWYIEQALNQERFTIRVRAILNCTEEEAKQLLEECKRASTVTACSISQFFSAAEFRALRGDSYSKIVEWCENLKGIYKKERT